MTLGDTSSEVFTVKYDPFDRNIAAGFGDGAIRIYDAWKGKCTTTLCSNLSKFGDSEDMPVTSIRWRPILPQYKTQNILVAAYCDGNIKHWHTTSGKVLYQRKCESQIYSIDYNCNGEILAAVGKDRNIYLYDDQTKSLISK